MTSQSRVNIHHLADFGQKTAGFGIHGGDHSTMSDFTDGLSEPLASIGKGAVAGTGLGTSEAKAVKNCYKQFVLDPLQSFTQDAPKALMALGGGAVVEAANYFDGDQNQLAAMTKVSKMFTANDDTGLDADLTKKQNADKAKKVKVVHLDPPTTEQDKGRLGNETQSHRAHREATALWKKYKNDIHWPKPPHKDDSHTKILAPGPLDGSPTSSTNSSTVV